MDKIDRLLDAIEHPERYTSTEIETLLQDTEIKEVFNLLDKTKSSLHPVATPDIDAEWEKFKNKHDNSKTSHRFRLTRFIPRNAAASIIIGIASFTSVAAIVGIGINRFKQNEPVIEVNVHTGVTTSQPDTIRAIEESKAQAPEQIVFDNETLETIVSKIAAYYGHTAVFKNNTSKSLRLYFRWNQALTIEEVVESLNNFEQIKLTINDKTIEIG
ncbi:MAG: DUF4974 domain-containing protein [Paramuribaculum sp.]|nr:DUF4974 domain-containing protein [Paramuribaculum sp.]